jgi:hypothetical protein
MEKKLFAFFSQEVSNKTACPQRRGTIAALFSGDVVTLTPFINIKPTLFPSQQHLHSSVLPSVLQILTSRNVMFSQNSNNFIKN